MGRVLHGLPLQGHRVWCCVRQPWDTAFQICSRLCRHLPPECPVRLASASPFAVRRSPCPAFWTHCALPVPQPLLLPWPETQPLSPGLAAPTLPRPHWPVASAPLPRSCSHVLGLQRGWRWQRGLGSVFSCLRHSHSGVGPPKGFFCHQASGPPRPPPLRPCSGLPLLPPRQGSVQCLCVTSPRDLHPRSTLQACPLS